MKLMFCKECYDIVKLTYELRECECGQCSGRYGPDGLQAHISGPALAMGVLNDSFTYALEKRLKDSKLWDDLYVTAFFIGSDSGHVEIEEG